MLGTLKKVEGGEGVGLGGINISMCMCECVRVCISVLMCAYIEGAVPKETLSATELITAAHAQDCEHTTKVQAELLHCDQ